MADADETNDDSASMLAAADALNREAVEERFLEQIKRNLTLRLTNRERSIESTFLDVDNMPTFGELVLMGVDQPCDWDGLLSQLTQKLDDTGVKQLCDQFESVSNLYDAAVANQEALLALERKVLLNCGICLGLLGDAPEMNDGEDLRSEVLKRLYRNQSDPDCNGMSFPALAFQRTDARNNYVRAVLQGQSQTCSPTFWEVALAGVDLPDKQPTHLDTVIATLFSSHEEGLLPTRRVSEAARGAVKRQLIIADKFHAAAAATKQEGQHIRQICREAGIQLDQKVRFKPWQRLNPYSRRAEGLQPE